MIGVQYLHSMGVAHRDLKPENLLLDASRKVLKISDFGVSEVFRTPFASMSQKCHGCAGSGPYIAPEEFKDVDYDAELIDVWAIGIILFVLTNTVGSCCSTTCLGQPPSSSAPTTSTMWITTVIFTR